MKWLKRLAIAVVAVLILAAPAHAAEQISTFDSKVVVQPSGRVDVTETIAYDFGYTSRHGIYRYIPVVYRDDQGNTYKPRLTFDSAQLDGQPVDYTTSRHGDNEVIRIGDAQTYVTGAKTYTITYHFESLVVNKGGDLLRFNVTGSGWQVPIAAVSAQITGPSAPQQVCYTGKVGSKARDCTIDAATGVVTATNLGNGKGLTVEALWPAGTVANHLEPYKTPWWLIATIIAAVTYVIAGLGLFMAAIIRWLGIRLAEKRAERDQTIIAEYQPPKGLTPGELGLITDNKTSLVEVTATLIQAAVAGYIKIEQVTEKSLLKKAEYKLIKVKDYTKLGHDEAQLLAVLFDGRSEVNLNAINKSTVPAAITKYQDNLRSSVQAKDMYTKTSKFISAGAAAGIVVLFVFAFTPLAFVIAALVLPLGIYYYKRAGRTPRRSAKGLKTWAHIEGFKLFLSVTEKDRLAFTDAPARTPKQFSTFLPYAIALGVEKEWAEQFKGIDVAKNMHWYHGSNTQAFTAGYLVGDLSNSFATTVASNVAPRSSSSGFGGGSSGGGFSGGGGGSW